MCIHILVLYYVFLFFTVTIARAIELKHNATLIAALAFETANFYQKAGQYNAHTGAIIGQVKS